MSKKSNNDNGGNDEKYSEPNLDGDQFSIVSMNVNGPGSASERRQLINEIINPLPCIIFLQEYTWSRDQYEFSDRYNHVGNKEASIMYRNDGRFQVVRDLPQSQVRDLPQSQVRELPQSHYDSILRDLQRTSNNPTGAPFPIDFDPQPRFCCLLITFQGKTFLAVSYHGKHRLKKPEKKDFFKRFLIYMDRVRRYNGETLPMLISGDWNVDLKEIQDLVSAPWQVHEYTASPRRISRGVIDYVITTNDFKLSNIEYIDVGESEVLDHDPIRATVTLRATATRSEPQQPPPAEKSKQKPDQLKCKYCGQYCVSSHEETCKHKQAQSKEDSRSHRSIPRDSHESLRSILRQAQVDIKFSSTGYF